MKKIVLIVIILLGVVICGLGVNSARAADYDLWLVGPHGGGSTDLTSGNYKLWDIKGQSIAGEATSGNFKGQFGGIYYLDGEAGAGPVVDLTDNGLVHHTVIERAGDAPGSDIIIKFRTVVGVNNVDIFRVSGTGKEYDKEEDPVLIAATVPVVEPGGEKDTVWKESSTALPNPKIKVGDGINAYYRIVPAGDQPYGIDPVSQKPLNARTVGKVDVSLQSGYNAISLPFKEQVYLLSSIIGDQLKEGDQIHYWNDEAQAYSLLTRLDQWPGYTFKFVEGFYVYLVGKDRNEKLTLVGEVGGFPEGFSWSLGKEYNLIGYPYPKSVSALVSGLTPTEGDQIHRWDWISQGFVLTTYVNNVWKDPAVTQFNLGEGKFYYIPKNGKEYNWELKF